MERVGDTYQIICAPSDFENVKKELIAKGVESKEAELSLIPSSFIKVNEKDGKRMIDLMDVIENHDDVQNVYANFNLSESQLIEMQN